jgi:hypothetical protein
VLFRSPLSTESTVCWKQSARKAANLRSRFLVLAAVGFHPKGVMRNWRRPE